MHGEPENEANIHVQQIYATRTMVWVQYYVNVTIVDEIFFSLKTLIY